MDGPCSYAGEVPKFTSNNRLVNCISFARNLADNFWVLFPLFNIHRAFIHDKTLNDKSRNIIKKHSQSIVDNLRAVLHHLCNTDADSPLVRVQALNGGQGLDSLCQTEQAVGGQVGAGNVLEVGAKVDARVLLSVAVGR